MDWQKERRVTKREAEFYTFHTHDDVALSYRYWPALTDVNTSEPITEKTNVTVSKAIVLFHRDHEHGGRMAH